MAYTKTRGKNFSSKINTLLNIDLNTMHDIIDFSVTIINFTLTDIRHMTFSNYALL